MQRESLSTSLIVRVTVAEDGALTGVIERPRTGEKHRFESVETLGILIANIVMKAARITTVPAVLTAVALGPGKPKNGAPGSSVATQEVFS